MKAEIYEISKKVSDKFNGLELHPRWVMSCKEAVIRIQHLEAEKLRIDRAAEKQKKEINESISANERHLKEVWAEFGH